MASTEKRAEWKKYRAKHFVESLDRNVELAAVRKYFMGKE